MHKALVYYLNMHSATGCQKMIITAKRSWVAVGFYFIKFMKREGLMQR